MHLSTSIALALTLVAGQTAARSVTEVRQLYDAGKYRDVVGAAGQASLDNDQAARLQYLVAQSYDKLKDTDATKSAYQRLADTGETPWGLIGKSALQLMDKKLDDALTSANQAVQLGASLPEAPYQRGIVLMTRKEYADAAGAFTKATQLDPAFAAAYYYAGLANSRVKRVDLMTNNFEKFIKLAPNAPERPEVESILRTMRGR
jgi:tetratricopeptide (TPR) repeat protein